MKSKKIDKLRYEDYEGTEVCLSLFQFLERLNIKSASNSADECCEYRNEFCSDCHVIKDDCDCRGQHDYDWDDRRWDDGDRAYDAWKDSQLEDKDEVF